VTVRDWRTRRADRECLDILEGKRSEAGFTLVELLISLVLFALIAMAGLALVEGLLGIQHRTEGRLDRLAEIQRAMFVLDNDLGQISAGPLEGQGDRLSFNRPVAAVGGLPVRVGYALGGGTLARSLEGRGLPGGAQHLLGGVASLRWSFYAPGVGWADHWPPNPDMDKKWPTAIAADIALAPGAGPTGSLRRVVALPAQP
jgi:general secretion pathway protein J